jgi:hypothetical protein
VVPFDPLTTDHQHAASCKTGSIRRCGSAERGYITDITDRLGFTLPQKWRVVPRAHKTLIMVFRGGLIFNGHVNLHAHSGIQNTIALGGTVQRIGHTGHWNSVLFNSILFSSEICPS